MAQNIKARALQGQTLSASEDRLINDILTEGVFDLAGGWKVRAQATPNMTVRVGSGVAYDRAVVAADYAGQSNFLVENQDPYVGNANADLPIAAADATNRRKDLAILRVYEDTFDSSGKHTVQVEIVQGTPASSPVEPALPASAQKLAVITVPAGATSIVDGDIADTRAAAAFFGSVLLSDGSASSPALTFGNDTDTGLFRTVADQIIVALGGVARYAFRVNDFVPISDNSNGLGSSARRWSAVYAVNGTIQTSDESVKTDVRQSDLGLAFVRSLRAVCYRWVDGVRPHYGLLAEDVIEKAKANGADDFGGYVDPSVKAVAPDRADYDDDESYADAVDEHAATLAAPKLLNYSEMIAPLVRAVQEEAAAREALQARVDGLESRIAALEAR
jgi:hypothetical protein